MGSGLYSTDTYYDRDRDRKASGRSAFDYHDTTLRTTPRDLWKAHATLDPKGGWPLILASLTRIGLVAFTTPSL